VVIKYIGNDKYLHSQWLCKCDCGKEKIILGTSLVKKRTKSCGCLKLKHGYRMKNKNQKTYNAWHSMIQRCDNTNHRCRKNYGGRGIAVCGRWLSYDDGFLNFLHDMGECPQGYQLDRINNNLGYFKENCRWTTPKINSRNKRNNRIIKYNDKEQCIASLADEHNIPYRILQRRIGDGWSIERAVTTPANVNRKKN